MSKVITKILSADWWAIKRRSHEDHRNIKALTKRVEILEAQIQALNQTGRLKPPNIVT